MLAKRLIEEKKSGTSRFRKFGLSQALEGEAKVTLILSSSESVSEIINSSSIKNVGITLFISYPLLAIH
ncbi:hypothetical protein GCM10011391_16520 [Pullulanibacillus camelliae]|uniref:Uncharacterized protein n=1 Tax=Pullulanibacillus camelliae TaxID=1707096 RepID=A0A8J2YGW9_9BACL|nr:hypothetical protein GCM10011391_16520 [Pullulanibacillus camelliae]